MGGLVGRSVRDEERGMDSGEWSKADKIDGLREIKGKRMEEGTSTRFSTRVVDTVV